MREFTYTIDPNYDYTIDEKGNTFIALRKIDWGNTGNYRLDLRKYYASESGETMNRGVSFLTEDGADELTKVLVDTGYGNDAELANSIIENRPNVLARIYKAVTDDLSLLDKADENLDDDYYDVEELVS